MLNISENSINRDIEQTKWTGLERVNNYRSGRVLIRILSTLVILFVLSLFLPWTQHIRTKGKVTTLLPQQRPQSIASIIPGRIEQWYVREGDEVVTGDTILFLSEVKSEYLDPNLVGRTGDQIDAKKSTAAAYQGKAIALSDQIRALKISRDAKINQAQNKIKQARLKIVSDSINLEAKIINLDIARQQFDRQLSLYNKGLKSLTDLEKRKLTLQKTEAEKVNAENKLMATRAGLIMADVEIDAIESKFQENFSKARSDRFSAMSNQYDTRGSINKLESQYAQYAQRNEYYYVTAPQGGVVTKTSKSGIGELVKEGDEVATIMPADYELAVEMYVKPINLPLLKRGQEVRFQFDGWPAIIFSGWPNNSYGTFGGEVYAIDNFISPNGFYRVIVSQSTTEPWPDLLRVGSGSNGLVLLNDVQIWYELWRNLNGFPADFYADDSSSSSMVKKEKK